MDDLIIEPKLGIGKITLGMSMKEVEACIAYYSKKHLGVDDDKNAIASSLQVAYDPEGKVNFIHLDSRITKYFNCLFRGVDVFSTKVDLLVKMIDEISPYDRNHPELGCTFYFPEIGLGLWRPRIFNEEDQLTKEFQELTPENQEDELRNLYFEVVCIEKDYYKNAKKDYIK
ncbi:hypothetical protein [Alkaliphilus transvaalensis]|uniref:hypothetical protein n=1 Tax=Alkaliphilus transvaalensis TaxID=114628 RepID=UPI0005504AE1|nr:hypothetical protein [Alkaliphilus transvaalensis]